MIWVPHSRQTETKSGVQCSNSQALTTLFLDRHDQKLQRDASNGSYQKQMHPRSTKQEHRPRHPIEHKNMVLLIIPTRLNPLRRVRWWYLGSHQISTPKRRWCDAASQSWTALASARAGNRRRPCDWWTSALPIQSPSILSIDNGKTIVRCNPSCWRISSFPTLRRFAGVSGKQVHVSRARPRAEAQLPAEEDDGVAIKPEQEVDWVDNGSDARHPRSSASLGEESAPQLDASYKLMVVGVGARCGRCVVLWNSCLSFVLDLFGQLFSGIAELWCDGVGDEA